MERIIDTYKEDDVAESFMTICQVMNTNDTDTDTIGLTHDRWMLRLTEHSNQYSKCEDAATTQIYNAFKKYHTLARLLYKLNNCKDTLSTQCESIIFNYIQNTTKFNLVVILIFATFFLNFETAMEGLEIQETMVRDGDIPEDLYLKYCRHIKFMYQIHKDYNNCPKKN
jgi:hypothetical protein